MKKDVINFISQNKIYLVLLVFFTILGFLFPYVADDWFWGTNWGLHQLKIGFSEVNGRWLGNILAIILTRSRILKSLAVGVTLTGIIYMINCFKEHKKNNILLTFLTIMTVSMAIFRETIAWTSGFVNYVVVDFFILLTLFLNKDLFFKQKVEFKRYTGLLFFFLGIINSLFMENVTLFNLSLSIFFIIYDIIKEKKVHKEHIIFVIGSIIGTAIMFINPIYISVFHSKDIYAMRSFSINGMFDKIKDVIFTDLIFNNIIFNLLLSIICLFIYNKNKNKRKISIISLCIMCAFSLYLIFYKIYNLEEINLSLISYFNFIFIVMYLISFIVFITENLKGNEKVFILFLIGCICFIVGPLFVVNPVDNRCMLPPYVIMVLILVILFDNAKIKNIDQILKFSSIFISFMFLLLYGAIFRYEYIRTKYINNHKGEDLVLYGLPSDEYIFYDHMKEYLYNFKEFYNIKDDVKLVSYKEWKKMK